MESHPVICIDLDGTIIEEGYYPRYGRPLPNAIESVNKLINAGYEVVIWTSRGNLDGYLDEAIQMLVDDGLNPNFKVNKHSNYCLARYREDSPKVFGNVYLDDRSYGAPDFSKDWLRIMEDFEV